MGLRFRRRVRILPGVNLNLSGSGASLSVGPRGASVSFGKRGTYANLGIPGTGLYAREKLSGSRRSTRAVSSSSEPTYTEVSLTVSMEDDGTVAFKDKDGNPLPPKLEREAKKQKGDAIRAWMEEKANEINAPQEQISDIHHLTPKPDNGPSIERKSFDRPAPQEPSLEAINPILGFFMHGKKRSIEEANSKKLSAFKHATEAWKKLKRSFDVDEEARIRRLQEELQENPSAMEEFLAKHLDSLEWPRETLVEFEISKDAATAFVDVDLPEIEDMPSKEAKAPSRGWKVSIKDLSEKSKRMSYMRHIHGVAFRIAGEIFSVLPSVKNIVISGYSQRPEKKTGNVVDEYLLSVRIDRDIWRSINFSNLPAVDPVSSLELFELNRKMTTTGIFKPIDPYRE
ncbi:MAG: DUF4236 domain-containing protein [gamma proteobacterium symbiont of Clathrolucina costata]